MPQYNYFCKNCGNTFIKFSTIKDYKQRRKCKCGKMAYHDIVADHKDGNVDSQMREYEFEGEHGTRMYGASYLDLAEAKRVHKDTDFIWRNECWIPRIKHRNHKKAYLKEMGYIEKD